MAKILIVPEILPPSDDRIFKVLLTHPDANGILIDIVSAVIERKVVDVQIRGNELPAMDINEKAERFDINCTVDTGEPQPSAKREGSRFDQVDVEMHCHETEEIDDEHTNLINKYT